MKAGAFVLQDLKAGTYSFSALCEVVDGCTKSSPSNTVTFTVSPKITAPSISASKTLACMTESINLKATGCEGGIVRWSNGQTGADIAYQVLGNATVTAKCEKNNQVSENSNPLFILTKQNLSITTSKTAICAGESVSLSSVGCMGTTFWNIDGKFKLGASVVVSPSQTTSYSATCDVTGDCANSGKTTIEITVSERPSVSLKSNLTGNAPALVGSTLALTAKPDGMSSYAWTGPANFATTVQNPSITNMQVANMGFYYCKVSNGSCSALGEIFVQVLNSNRLGNAEEIADLDLNVYPNPSNDVINLKVVLVNPSPLEISLIDATGRRLNTWQSAESKAIHQQKLDISTVKDGIYFILVESQTEKGIKKIVKARE